MNRTFADRTKTQEERCITLSDTMARELVVNAIRSAYLFKPEVVAAGIMIAHGVTYDQAHQALCRPCARMVGIDIAVKNAVMNAFDSAFKGCLTPNNTSGL
jgi:hypothetical protein